MSWAEIKKAVNSNLDVPLNEQIDEIGKYRIGLTPITTYNTTSVNINNSKGFLYSVIARTTSNQTGTVLSVKIDGQTVFNYSTLTDAGLYMAIIPPADLKYSSYSSNSIFAIQFNQSIYSNTYGNVRVWDSKQVGSLPSMMNIYYLYEPLYFGKSMQITSNGMIVRLNYALIQ